ncbi:MAG: polyprenyl synthetase family protein [Candidatus Heimdallarchaeaceae archaeon]
MTKEAFDLSTEVEQINSYLNNLRDYSPYDDEINDLIDQILNNGGKRIRPLICLLSFEMISNKVRDDSSFAAACALEIIHNASLIVDDIFDKDVYRRKEKSFYLKYSTFSALSLSYSMSSLALSLASKTEMLEIVEEIINAISTLSTSLFLEQKFREGSKKMSKKESLQLIDRKTSVLFQAASVIGFILGNSTKEDREKMKTFGTYIGRAFQLRDDYLSLTVDQGDLGKSGVETDITNRIQTYLVLEAFDSLPEEERLILHEYYLEKKENSIETIRDILLNSEAISTVKVLVKHYINEANLILNEFPRSIARDKLISITSMLEI